MAKFFDTDKLSLVNEVLRLKFSAKPELAKIIPIIRNAFAGRASLLSTARLQFLFLAALLTNVRRRNKPIKDRRTNHRLVIGHKLSAPRLSHIGIRKLSFPSHLTINPSDLSDLISSSLSTISPPIIRHVQHFECLHAIVGQHQEKAYRHTSDSE
jgi:hypothetical protein